MDILQKIISAKKEEVRSRKELYPIKLLEKSIYFDTEAVSITKYLSRDDLLGIIAEFKRESPSKGMINEFSTVEDVSIAYMRSGASALSILTDKEFFGGNSKFLEKARTLNYCPILRKDFIVDEYQVVETKSIGADVILLIAAALEKSEIEKLSKLSQEIGLEVLVEIHNEQELDKINFDFIDIVGVNNRDLATFKVDINTSLKLFEKIPKDKIAISESGINSPEDLVKLKQAGFKGFLIGERFMKSSDPGEECRSFIEEAKRLLEQ